MIKYAIFSFAVFFFSTLTSFAGGKEVGNGGNAVICSKDGAPVIELLDYYELRLNGGVLSLNSKLGSYQNILLDLFERWSGNAPVRMAQYEKWLKEFVGEAGIISGATIPPISDTGTILIPAGCRLQPIAFQRPDGEVLPRVKRYTIDKDIWDSLPEVQKAGLVLHELIYREGILAGHITSYPTRYFNGYLASATPNSFEYAGVVSQLPLLWTEYGGAVIVEIGQMKEQRDCSQCLSFNRKSNISIDGKSLHAEISQILGPLETDDFTVRFDEGLFNYGPLLYPILINFENGMLQVDASNRGQGRRSFSNIITGIQIKDRLNFVFTATGIAFKIYLNVNAGQESAPIDVYQEATLDPTQSWYKNYDKHIIDQIRELRGGLIVTSDSIWDWDRNLKKFVKRPPR